MIGDELFAPPYQDRIKRVLPTLFNMVDLENRRGKKLGMEVGTARERVIIALLMYVYGKDVVEFPPTTSPELDVIVKGEAISIKTKTGGGYAGVKLSWAVDWAKVGQFANKHKPESHLLFINIEWGKERGFFLIPKEAQQEVWEQLDIEYFKLPKKDTNSRGVEMSSEAMRAIQEHKDTKSMQITWKRDPTLLRERHLYERWIELWDSL